MRKNSEEKDPRTFEEKSHNFQERGHKEERWRIQERKIEGKWKKRWKKKRKKKRTECRKSTRTRWIRKSFVSAFMRKRKVERERKIYVEIKRNTPRPKYTWSDGEDGFSSFLLLGKKCQV